jgi:hypothetical protein
MKTTGMNVGGVAWTLAARAVVMVLVLGISGCEDDDDSDKAETAETAASAQSSEDDATTDDRFPDGLHPSGGAVTTIARVFAGALGGSPGDGSDANTVVCLGDSITAGGYPAALSGLTGTRVVNAGSGGEYSSGGAGRVGGLLEQHKPGYLCVLYGINDLNGGRSPGEVIANLNAIIAAAKDAGAVPVVGTLTPVSGKYAHLQGAVDELNGGIRSLGANIADLAKAF